MGLKRSSCIFSHKAMSMEVLKELISEIYIDDILVYGKSGEEYPKALEMLFSRLRDKNVTLNPDKCRLGLNEVEYVGHTLSASTGIFFSDQKKTKILVIQRAKATDID
jgi:hypothetical protein